MASKVETRKRRFVRQVVEWEKKNFEPFPWRDSPTPYEVFISEVLLKRTTRTAVNRMFDAFLARFPDISALAEAEMSEVEEMLQPIGLHRQRSKGLKEAAMHIVSDLNCTIPSSYEELLEVPHIGAYTAGAIMSFGVGKPAAILDSNVRRVVTKVFADLLGESPSDKDLLNFLRDVVPKKNHKMYNWGLVDLGAVVCTYRAQRCDICPVTDLCHHFQPKRQERI